MNMSCDLDRTQTEAKDALVEYIKPTEAMIAAGIAKLPFVDQDWLSPRGIVVDVYQAMFELRHVGRG